MKLTAVFYGYKDITFHLKESCRMFEPEQNRAISKAKFIFNKFAEMRLEDGMLAIIKTAKNMGIEVYSDDGLKASIGHLKINPKTKSPEIALSSTNTFETHRTAIAYALAILSLRGKGYVKKQVQVQLCPSGTDKEAMHLNRQTNAFVAELLTPEKIYVSYWRQMEAEKISESQIVKRMAKIFGVSDLSASARGFNLGLRLA